MRKKRTVDQLRGVVDDRFDLTILLQVADSNTGQASVDFQALNEDALADELEGGNLLDDALIQGLVEDDGVLGLILDLSLRPLLFLCGLSLAR